MGGHCSGAQSLAFRHRLCQGLTVGPFGQVTPKRPSTSLVKASGKQTLTQSIGCSLPQAEKGPSSQSSLQEAIRSYSRLHFLSPSEIQQLSKSLTKSFLIRELILIWKGVNGEEKLFPSESDPPTPHPHNHPLAQCPLDDRLVTLIYKRELVHVGGRHTEPVSKGHFDKSICFLWGAIQHGHRRIKSFRRCRVPFPWLWVLRQLGPLSEDWGGQVRKDPLR